MGYSKSEAAVLRVVHILNRLEDQKITVELRSTDPHVLAYRLREAIYAAQHHDVYRHLADLSERYVFRVRPGMVTAEYVGDDGRQKPREGPFDDADEKQIELQAEALPEDLEIPTDFRALQLKDVTTLHGIVGAVIRFGSANEEIYFPFASLDHEDRVKLLAWCDSLAARWGFIDHEEAGLTMTRSPSIDPELLWSP